MRHIVIILAILSISLNVYQINTNRNEMGRIGICHSITEDSVITDCDYQNGQWRPNAAKWDFRGMSDDMTQK